MNGGQIEKHGSLLDGSQSPPPREPAVSDVGITIRKEKAAGSRQPLGLAARVGWIVTVVTLLSIGWYASTRAADERAEAMRNIPRFQGEFYTEDFSRGALGDVELGRRTVAGEFDWSSLGAGWFATEDEVAQVGEGEPGKNSLAIVDLGDSDYTLVTTVINASSGSGVVFRYRDTDNHWALLAAPEFAAWNLVRIEDQEQVFKQTIDYASTDKESTIAISVLGPQIKVFIDGYPYLSLIDSTLRNERFAGFVGQNSTGAAYDDFTVLPDPRAVVPGGAANG